jgi:hypothetical protein
MGLFFTHLVEKKLEPLARSVPITLRRTRTGFELRENSSLSTRNTA